MASYAEHIASLEATRKEKADRMKEIHAKASAENRTMDEVESAEFDELDRDIKAINVDLERTNRLKALEDSDAATAVPVSAARGSVKASPLAVTHSTMELKKVEKLEPGIAMARYAMCLVAAKGKHDVAFSLAKQHYPQTECVVRTLKAQAEGANLQHMMVTKAAVAAGTTTDSTWAAPLVDAQTFAGDFIEFLRPKTLVGQAQFRRIPFNVRVVGQTSGGTAYWVGQGKPKPVTKFDFNATTVPFTKIAAISVITQELARFSDPSAQALVRDSLADAVIERADSDLFDPDLAAVANVSPAGLLNGVAPVTGPASTDSDDIRCALLRLWAPWDATNIGMRPAYYTTPAVARFLAFARDSLGNPSFPGVTPFGGTLDGVPLRVSNYLANNGGSGGAPLILVDESEIWLADDGSVTVDASEQASLQLDDAPTNSSSASVTATSLVSMWQTNSIALRAERFIWWGARRSGAVQWIDGFPIAC